MKCLLSPGPRSATVMTKTPALIYEINKESLEPLFESSLPESIAQTVAERDTHRECHGSEEDLAIETRQTEAKGFSQMKRFFQL